MLLINGDIGQKAGLFDQMKAVLSLRGIKKSKFVLQAVRSGGRLEIGGRNMAAEIYRMVSFLFAAAVFLAVLSIVYASWRNGITPMPASRLVRREVSNEIHRLNKQGSLADAGSGWGTLALHLAKRCTGWRIIGIENSVIPLAVSKLLARLALRKDQFVASAEPGNPISFIRGNLYKYPYETVDLIVCYLFPGAMRRLSGIFRDRLTPGQCIISICFALPGWEPDRVITCRDLYRTPVYVYTVK
ncbi:class I SAM-dependent methyltransferase [Cohnella sp.]|uniref:class I SAM-dependent methyltransferase n=1 Tax=Cohnella sp. TaxID=1883426 RepID=UPI0035690414